LYSNGFNLSSYTSNDGSIELEVSGGSLPYTYTWSNGDTSEDLANLSSGEYTLVIADSAGCPVTGSITLTRPNSPPGPNPNPGTTEFSLPNAFTPNGDGFNDAYRINSLLPDYALNKFMVWDISRRLVFSAENYDNTWTGLDNSGKKLPAGTYFAVFESSKLTEPVKTYIDLRYE
jgi:gliding motility-associated-like protein